MSSNKPLLLEYWEPIPGFEIYQASYSGKIRHLGKFTRRYSRKEPQWTPPQIFIGASNAGYRSLTLTENGIRHYKSVHYLVAVTFIPNPNNLPEINHLNFDRSDNRACNLEWASHKRNMQHASDKIRQSVLNFHKIKKSKLQKHE